MTHRYDADVLVIGSGFGGAVAALRFAESGQRVVVLERGPWVRRDAFHRLSHLFWSPRSGRLGPHDLQCRGETIIPWLGSGVGGGSQIYSGTLARRESFADFPRAIADDEMQRYYERAEGVLRPNPYPYRRRPYDDARAVRLMREAGEQLAAERPDLVQGTGLVPLGTSFAPEGEQAGAEFENHCGATQRYWDPRQQALLGGDHGGKNTLDKNYLFLAQRAGARVHPLTEADRIEPLPGGGYQVHATRLSADLGEGEATSFSARVVVVAAGSIGSTQLLLRNRDLHRTLPRLGPALGQRYTTNGDFVSLIWPTRGLLLGWLGFLAALAGLLAGWTWTALAGALAYLAGVLLAGPPADPDIGTTCSDYLCLRGEDGSEQGGYIQGGRYPTPIRLGLAMLLSVLGLWRPARYTALIRITRLLRWVPPFALLDRTWPLALLEMGRDRALGTFRLDDQGQAVIDFDGQANRDYYAHLDRVCRLVARAAGRWWMPNLLYRWFNKLIICHNQGGVPMGETARTGVVDHAGRVFGHRDLMVLDGSILPVSLGPNPALTILAVSERAAEIACAQLRREGEIAAAGDAATRDDTAERREKVTRAG
jgi:cholesterol oxidase